MDKERKKAWTRPQLIVVVRGNPEESVLLKCKMYSETGPGAGPCAVCSESRPS
jgi:hypothetical protein